MKYNQLGTTDMMMSHISLGGAGFSNIYGDFDELKSVELIRECLARGINYIETGPWYGQGTSEMTIGKALQGVPRQSYYISSKVGRYSKDPAKMFDFTTEKTLAAVDSTLQLLGVDYVDLIQVHDVAFGDLNVIMNETLPTLEKVVRDGKARYIGIADYDLDLMKDIVETSKVKIASVLSYAKSTIIDNRLQDYASYFKSKDVGVINAAATGMGLLTNAGPPAWHPADEETKKLCLVAAEMCKKKDVELARLATWFTLRQPGNDTNLYGFRTVDQLVDTINVMDQGLSTVEETLYNDIVKLFQAPGSLPLHWDKVSCRVSKDTKK